MDLIIKASSAIINLMEKASGSLEMKARKAMFFKDLLYKGRLKMKKIQMKNHKLNWTGKVI
jgi:hypothetical protein